VSNNYFKTGWGFNTYRRIRNTVIVMDYVPDMGASALRLKQMHDMQYMPVLTDKQNELAAVAFKLFNLKGDGKVSSMHSRARCC
jgi:hypothetical protein